MLYKRLRILMISSLIIVLTSVICLVIRYNINKTKDITVAKELDVQSSEKLVEEDKTLIYNDKELIKKTVEKAVEIYEFQKKKEEGEKLKKEEINITNPKVTTKPTTKSTNNVAQYYIKVNYQANVVTIYAKDKNGEYTIPYKAMVCSTGSATPHSGVYTIPSGSRSKGTWGLMVGGVYAQYYTRIVGSILFHSVPYTKKDKSSLEYWEYDKLGTTASAGCVRLTVQDAKWIYNNCKTGTKVEFYADSNPGPLGKPSARKISNENDKLKNWDPTDSDNNNPWKNHNKENDKNIQTNNTINKNNTTNNTIDKNNNNIINNVTNDKTKDVNETIDNNSVKDTNNTINNSN